jgi:hypothetical protein
MLWCIRPWGQGNDPFGPCSNHEGVLIKPRGDDSRQTAMDRDPDEAQPVVAAAVEIQANNSEK